MRPRGVAPVRYRDNAPTWGQTLQRAKGNDPVTRLDQVLGVVLVAAVAVLAGTLIAVGVALS